ncbi:MAG: efflux RND transporter periplasmic adaptor subunit [Caldilineaceae bacterium]|nr:efflux RND transporter periplasmic adaptor subunit [Caldilineaceae bacterium]
MRRWILWIFVLAVIGIGGWFGYNYYQEQQARAAEEEAARAEPTPDLERVIWASGRLQPVTWAGLAPSASGTVARINVKVGDRVTAGDVLLELSNDTLKSQVAVAEAAVSEAEAALAKLNAGPTRADIAAAEAAVETAKAQVAVAAAQMLEVQAAIDAANAEVRIAQARYAEVAGHPTPAEQVQAQALIAQAEAGLRNAQAAYNLVKGDPAIGARPESLALAQATANLEAAKAQQAVVAQGPTAQQLAVAARAIDAARVGVQAAENRVPGAEANVRAAMAQVESAQAALDKLLAGATPEEIQMAEARVQSAQAALGSALAQLRQSQVIAPFDGQVGAVNVRLGELIDPGKYAILLGDTSGMHVETTDLRETDVIRVHDGMPVEVTFDAMPDVVFQGTVTDVAPVSTAEQGSTNYTVHISVPNLDADLRWGMTAFVNIQTE